MKTKFKTRVFGLTILTLFVCVEIFSQTQNVGIGTTTPDNSAILELYSTTHGFLVPRLTSGQRNGITNPATGLLIYNLDNQRFEYYTGTQWIAVVSSVSTVPFNLIATGTNTTATMTVGTGSSVVIGGGIIEANKFKGSGSTTDAVDLNTSEVAGVLPIASGGTGNSTTPGQGELLIGNGTGFSLNQLTAGNGISITNGAGTITITDANASNEVIGTGALGQISFWDGTNSITGDNNLYWDNTNKRLGIGTNNPDNSAILELYSTTHGFLVPRLTSGQRNGITNPATGLLIYNLDNQRFEYYTGTQWIAVVSSVSTVPFNLIATGTNTTATMTVGTGSSVVIGGGIIEANKFKGSGSTTDAVDLNTSEVAGVLPIASGGTGNSTTPGQGELLIGNGTGFSLNQLTAGNGISITNGAGTITITDANASNEVTGTGALGQISFWDGTNSITGDNNLYWDNTNKRLGIGTTSPNERLHISGNLQFTGALMPNGSTGTTGQVLVSQGAGNAPQWTSASTIESDPVYTAAIPNIVFDGDAASGDLSGTYPGPTVSKLLGRTLSTSPPAQGQVYKWNGIAGLWEPSDVGTVTSVALQMPPDFSVIGSPVNSNGTFVVNWNQQGANTVLAGPITGSGTPSFRTLTDADIPDNITVTNYLPLSGGTMTGTINFAIEQTFPGTVTGVGSSPYLAIWNGGSSITYDTRLQWSNAENALVVQNSIGLVNAGNGSNYLRTSPTQNVAISYYLPTNLPTNTGFLQSDASGNLSWQTLEMLPTATIGQTLRYNSGWEATNLIFQDVSNNRIGLNITTPSVLLHQDQGTDNSTYHKFTAGSTTGTGLNDGFDIGIDNIGNAVLRQNENLPLIFQTNGTERMRLLANGKLGIGTTAIIDDSILVQTNGDVYIDGDLVVTGNIDPKVIYFQPLNFNPTVISKGAVFYDNNNDVLRVYNGSSWSSLVTQNSLENEIRSTAWKTNGNTGLNESTNFLGTTDNVGFKIRTNNIDRITVSSSGNVGIGTTNPNSTLSVDGSISNKVTIVNTNQTLDDTFHTVVANSTSGITITLPSPSSSNIGRNYIIKNINTGIVTINGSIEGSTSITLRQRESIELISNGSTWVVTNSYQPVPPVGSIIAWHKDFSNTPALPFGWVECNGQTLNDLSSPYHNQVIPNLNGDPNGANSPGLSEKIGVFLRGGTTSGVGQNDAFQGHKHSVDPDGALKYQYQYQTYIIETGGNYGVVANISVGNPTSDGTNGTPRTANETRPKNMSVVWIMRVK